MNSKEIRQSFFTFFESKKHQIVPSAPMVVKNDPTLMFTNAGMNQFKDIFLGNHPAKFSRVADSQKCLRVSGKHNDLEEVGHDTYHHTMFEMLGNWSFGDYFKKEAIAWAYEYLVTTLGIDKDRLYATVFEGDQEDGLSLDTEAFEYWKNYLPEAQILTGNKKDNFWEMGDTGPCGPCSEIHVDIRPDKERQAKPGAELVNMDHPQVIEIWNLVFMQFNRKTDKSLHPLPNMHVDTGMGFERLCMVLQGTRSNYDTDVFQPIIQTLAKKANKPYGKDEKTDIAMRVMSDHLRAIAFSIADGQLPSNNKAGYVIRRILRRAVRYGYTYLGFNQPVLFSLLPVLIETMGNAFPELSKQEELIGKVIKEEEQSFLRTLATGIRMLDLIIEKTKAKDYKVIDGATAFELYDTYGFPLDLTELILKEQDLVVNRKEFETEMQAQKDRSRTATKITTDDWVQLHADDKEEFIGYDYTSGKIKITRYRKIEKKGKTFYQLVFNYTPFYAESGGQVGDTGYIEADGKKFAILDTQKENDLIIHLTKELPEHPEMEFEAVVDTARRTQTANNHTATHLLHNALRDVLGTHVEQKGSLVHPDYLRFDFSHFQKVTNEELQEVTRRVNERIRDNIALEEKREIPIEKAQKMGAMSLFGEKYSDLVRVIRFDNSIELCGGTHVTATGQIGHFIITSESAISAGIRRIEAITGPKADAYIEQRITAYQKISSMLNNPKDVTTGIQQLIDENTTLRKQLEEQVKQQALGFKSELEKTREEIGDIHFIGATTPIDSPQAIKDLAFQMRNENERLFLILGATIKGKANLSIMITDDLVKEKGLNAGEMIREIAKEVQGGGGGQPFFATAGGKKPEGLEKAIAKAKEMLTAAIH